MWFKKSNKRKSIIRIIKKSIIESNPYEKWNQFIDLIAMEDYKELTQTQRVAHLCFCYDSEVQNGGHIQYFTNRKGEHLDEILNALERIKAFQQKQIIDNISNLYRFIDLGDVTEKEDYIARVLVGYGFEYKDEDTRERFGAIVDKYDKEYYECIPRTIDLLGDYLNENEEEFIKVV